MYNLLYRTHPLKVLSPKYPKRNSFEESRKPLCTNLEAAPPNLIGLLDLPELLTSIFPLDFHKVQDTGMFSHDPNVGISHSQLNPLGSFTDNRKSCRCSESSSGEHKLSLCFQSLQQL